MSRHIILLIFFLTLQPVMHAQLRIATPTTTRTAPTGQEQAQPPVSQQAQSPQNSPQQPAAPQQQVVQEKPWDKEDREELAIVLGGFAQIVTHFAHIVQDPHTTQNVAQGVGGILCSIGSIIAQAIKSHILVFDTAQEYEEFEQALTRIMLLQE